MQVVNKIFFSLLILTLFSCGDNKVKLNSAKKTTTQICSTETTDTGYNLVLCDGTVLPINNGKDGKDGAIGAKGDTGNTGATGPKGDAGVVGATGAKGDTGEKGEVGATGATGNQGPKGDKGDVGDQGLKGDKGDKGDKGVVGSSVKVPKNSCVQVGLNVWVENINNGLLFDVYYNPNCSDNGGEYCDNVIPSYGSSGQLNHEEHPGSGTTCWADNIQITGHRPNNSGDIVIKILDFN